MKITKIKSFLAAALLASLFISCASVATTDGSSSKSGKSAKSSKAASASSQSTELSKDDKKLPPPPAKLTEAPKYDFTGATLKIEAENMYYDGLDLIGDFNASGCYALKLKSDASWAIAEINFPAGSYEGLVNVLAPDSDHSRFVVYINKDTFLTYASEPPIGKYELTTRSPVSFTLDQPTTVTLKIQQNDIRNPAISGHTGMNLDYVTFKKIK